MNKIKRRREKKGFTIWYENEEQHLNHPLKSILNSEVNPQNLESNTNFIKGEIKKIIGDISTITQRYDPLSLLAGLFLKYYEFHPEDYKETIHGGRCVFIEYALSLIMSKGRTSKKTYPSQKIVDKLSQLVEQVFRNVMNYFKSEINFKERGETKEKELRLLSVLDYLLVRGRSYPLHYMDLARNLFEPHNQFLKLHFNLTVEDIITWILAIIESPNNLTKLLKIKIQELEPFVQQFNEVEQVEEFSTSQNSSAESLIKSEIIHKLEEIEALRNVRKEKFFQIEPTDKKSKSLLELLSLKFGENEEFLSFEKTPGWPTNDSLVFEKPLIWDGTSYYCFVPHIFFEKLVNIIEIWIHSTDKTYFEQRYQKKRADFLERKALEYLGNILPSSKSYHKLYYTIYEGTRERRCEVDGLILFDENIFIIEAKAGAISVPAQRGSIIGIKKDLKVLVKKPFDQAIRTKDYILNTEKPEFEDENGNVVLVIDAKDKYRDFFLINVTLKNIEPFSIQLNSLKKIEVLRGNEWPWSIFLNNLRIMSEIFECPSQFLVYLQKRIKFNDYPQFFLNDEMDFFMLYLKGMLNIAEHTLANSDYFMLYSHTHDLDRYYSYLMGGIAHAEKPKLKIPKFYMNLIKKLELTKKFGFTRITRTLLDFPSGTIHKFSSNIEQLIKLANDGYDHNLTVHPKDKRLGLTFWITQRKLDEFWDDLKNYIHFQMYHTRFEEWHVVIIEIERNSDTSIDFELFTNHWKFDPTLEEGLINFRTHLSTKHKRLGKIVGRNKPCNCGSGLKYKKCCGKRLKATFAS